MTAISFLTELRAKRASIEDDVYAHWLKHSNASHALDNGNWVNNSNV